MHYTLFNSKRIEKIKDELKFNELMLWDTNGFSVSGLSWLLDLRGMEMYLIWRWFLQVNR